MIRKTFNTEMVEAFFALFLASCPSSSRRTSFLKPQTKSCVRNPGAGKPCRNPRAEDACPGHKPMSKYVRRWSNLIQLVPLSWLEVWICRKVCVYLYIKFTRACVNPAPRPISWTGKAGAGVFSVDGKVGGEWKKLSSKSRSIGR